MIGEESAERGADGDHAKKRRERHGDDGERCRIDHEEDGRQDEYIGDDERRYR